MSRRCFDVYSVFDLFTAKRGIDRITKTVFLYKMLHARAIASLLAERKHVKPLRDVGDQRLSEEVEFVLLLCTFEFPESVFYAIVPSYIHYVFNAIF